MRRTLRRATAVAAASVVALTLLAGVSPATAAASPEPTDDPVAAAGGPTDVAVPYLGDTKITPSPPWTIADCAGPLAATPLVVACDASQISLAAPEFDPAAGMTVLPVTLTDGARTVEIEYRLTLAPPEAPTLAIAAAARPLAAGALLRVPISDFGVACTLCTQGGTLRIHDVEPAEAGTAWVTATHVVFRASSSYRGAAEVQFWYGDDVGTETGGIVPVFVYPPTDAPLLAMDVFVPVDDDGAATIDLTALVTSAGSAEPALVMCGHALTGTVSCDADGTARYRGAGASDQFGFQFGAGGERAFGSITLVPADDPRAGEGVRPVPAAPGAQDAEAPLATLFVPPVPRTDTTAPSGVFAALTAMLDRVGAR